MDNALSMGAANLSTYNRPDVVSHYAILDYLTPCEQLLFDNYIRPGDAVLDLGVGGGRTTPYLSERASNYIGVDYAPEMIRLCQRKYPDLEFVEGDASDLSDFSSGSFDAVVIAFNGLDYVVPDLKRAQCLAECQRVLKPGGVLLFSSHNARQILERPSWNPKRVHSLARDLVRSFHVPLQPVRLALTLAATARAWLRAAWKTLCCAAFKLPRSTFWRGEGYLQDAAHGGLTTHFWAPARVISDLRKHGMRIEKVLGDDYPHASGEFITGWYYYVFSKPNSAGSGEHCK